MNTRIVLILTTRCNFKCRHCIREYYNKHYDISFPLLKKSLKEAKELGFNYVDARLDSELAVKQLTGVYKVKNAGLAKRVLDVYNLKQSFREVRFTHIRREKNTRADAMVNVAIDRELAG